MQYWNGHQWQKMRMRTIVRAWWKRLFTLPWRPWVATKEVAPEDWVKGDMGLSGRRYWLRHDRGEV